MNASVMWCVGLLLCFFFYSFLGWVVEVIYAAFETHSLVNRGFLNGPVCPIYGCGMIALLWLMSFVGQNLVLEFLLGMAVATLVELAGGWVLFKIFHTRWWDYSNFPCNLGGYICLRFSLLWGAGSVFMVRVMHPPVRWLLAKIVETPAFQLPALLVCVLLAAVFGVDIGLSAAAAAGLGRYLAEIDALRGRMRTVSDRLTSVIGGNAMELDEVLDAQRLQMRLAAMEGRDDLADLRGELSEQIADLQKSAAAARAKLEQLAGQRFVGTGRLLRAFPQMHAPLHSEALSAVWRRFKG